jgi:muramoyltetrapeptide carboxypeptidase
LKQVHLIAPSGASPDVRNPLAGIEWLKQQGITIHNAECVSRVEQRFAGSDAERLAEINQLQHLPSDYLVMAMRGGYGLHRLLPNIEWDSIATAVKRGVQICGHSDLTVFQLALLAKTGAISLAGPMLNYDFGRQDEQGKAIAPDVVMWKCFQTAVQERKFDCQVTRTQSYLGKEDSGSSSGMLWGGNLTVMAGLVGTVYMPTFEKTQGGILFLEDVNEHPYRIERMLIQLLDAGILGNQSAIVLGGFSAYRLYDNDRGYRLESAIEAIRTRLSPEIPILTGLPFGHQAEKITLPVGAIAKLSYRTQGFILESQW